MNVGQVTLANLTAAGVLTGSNTTGISSASDASSPTASASSSVVPVAVSIAVPLIVLLAAALIACGILFSQNRKLRQEKEDYVNHSNAPLMDTQDGTRPGAASPAPVYEYKAPTAQTTWVASHPNPAQYASLDQEPIEAGSTHIGELPTNEIRQSEK